MSRPAEPQVEADEFLVVLHQLERLGARADLFGDAIQFVIEHVAQALGENEREDVVLEFWRVLRAANGTSGVPDPGFEGFVVTVGHSSFLRFRVGFNIDSGNAIQDPPAPTRA